MICVGIFFCLWFVMSGCYMTFCFITSIVTYLTCTWHAYSTVSPNSSCIKTVAYLPKLDWPRIQHKCNLSLLYPSESKNGFFLHCKVNLSICFFDLVNFDCTSRPHVTNKRLIQLSINIWDKHYHTLTKQRSEPGNQNRQMDNSRKLG